MAFDYKKEYKEFYLPKATPKIITIPAMNFIAVQGRGNPNREGGEYKTALSLLYGIAFTIKMSKKRRSPNRGLLRLCGSAFGRPVVAGRPREHRLHPERRLSMDFYDPPARFCNLGRI